MKPHSIKPFPIPVVATIGPGSQADDEGLDYLPMPEGMATFRASPLPEPELLAAHVECLRALHQALAALRRPGASEATQVIDLAALDDGDRLLLNQVLGEGEVAAQLLGEDAVRVQESVFAGVWRVIRLAGGRVQSDTLEIGSVPQLLVDAARDDGHRARPLLDAVPDGVMNAPSLLAEIDEQQHHWTDRQPPHVINLTLLPLSAGDSAYLDNQLGAGRVLILSRGYGNCRIVNTRLAHTWRVTYFNSTDIIILDTLEVCRVPEVGCAAAEDLEDSAERLAEVLDWVRAA